MIFVLWEKEPRRIVKTYETTSEPLTTTKAYCSSKGFELVPLERVSAGASPDDLDRIIKKDIAEDEAT